MASSAANLHWIEGYPIPYYYRIGARRILIEDLGKTRVPNMMELDLRLAKDVSFGPIKMGIAAEGFNITNNRTILQRNNRIYRSLNTPNATADNVEEIMSPRIFRLSAKLSF
ncbi:MAG: hypothetical protein ACXW29_00845 [Thermoanaerobaculia bacterium]